LGQAQAKFELFYKELMPLLPSLFSTFNRLQRAAQTSSAKGNIFRKKLLLFCVILNKSVVFCRVFKKKKDLFVELALSVPVRLTHMLPSLDLMMQPLWMALENGNDLVSQGKNIKYCCSFVFV
jgi:transformation/transcription domain-associated protein